eukprot:jgi/Mesvir1/5853/Mv00644-RA.1
MAGVVLFQHRHSTFASDTTYRLLLQLRSPKHRKQLLPNQLKSAVISPLTYARGQRTPAGRVSKAPAVVMASAVRSQRQMMQREPYHAPAWLAGLQPPAERIALGQFPTPIHIWQPPGLPKGVELWIKRDDLTGMQLSGNKVRKLEFLLADATAKGHDCVVTIGGIQSNHCRATAVAARYTGLDSCLVLRTSKALVDSDPGLVGNLLVERMVGASIQLVTKEEYATHGGMALGEMAVKRLREAGRNPYLIPVGGSNALGSWGYVDAMAELQGQLAAGLGPPGGFDDIVFACGSGGTAAGIAAGVRLSGMKSKVHSYGVCDDPEYFYNFIQGLLDGMGIKASARELLECHQAKGVGYAISQKEELELTCQVAATTGVVLDPVYSSLPTSKKTCIAHTQLDGHHFGAGFPVCCSLSRIRYAFPGTMCQGSQVHGTLANKSSAQPQGQGRVFQGETLL